jgi:WD40 repeat protein
LRFELFLHKNLPGETEDFMDDRIILRDPDYVLLYDTEAEIILILNKQSTGKEIRIEDKLESVWKSSGSNQLIIIASKTLPGVYDPRNHSLAKIRNPHGSSYRILGKRLLVGGDDQNPMLWIRKDQEYHLLMKSSSGCEPDSYSISQTKDGHRVVRIGNAYHPLIPESAKPVYPKPKEIVAEKTELDISAECSTLGSNELSFSLFLAKATKLYYDLAISPNNKWAIQYSIYDSKLSIWMNKNDKMQLRGSMNNACGIRSACFLGRNDYLASLDTIGTLKIWYLDEDGMTRRHIIHRSQFENLTEHQSISYEAKDNCLICHHKTGIDFYSLHLETKNLENKNQMLRYLKSFRSEPEPIISQGKSTDLRIEPAKQVSPVTIKPSKPKKKKHKKKRRIEPQAKVYTEDEILENRRHFLG